MARRPERELKHVKGIMLSLPEKENIMGLLKRTMEKGQLKIPYDSELINEINVERYEQTQAGQTKFTHPNGTHDDRLWALAYTPRDPRYQDSSPSSPSDTSATRGTTARKTTRSAGKRL